jgi:hypothetical protein
MLRVALPTRTSHSGSDKINTSKRQATTTRGAATSRTHISPSYRPTCGPRSPQATSASPSRSPVTRIFIASLIVEGTPKDIKSAQQNAVDGRAVSSSIDLRSSRVSLIFYLMILSQLETILTLRERYQVRHVSMAKVSSCGNT